MYVFFGRPGGSYEGGGTVNTDTSAIQGGESLNDRKTNKI